MSVVAGARVTAPDAIELTSPGPGLFRISVAIGDVLRPGCVLGALEVLGKTRLILGPETGFGTVTGVCASGTARPAVDFGAVLVTVNPRASAGIEAATAAKPGATAASLGGRVFRAPTSGRFYGRSAPDKSPFVTPGVELSAGATICLLEVMKTFHRVTYAGEPARVREVLVVDGADVNAGDPLLALD